MDRQAFTCFRCGITSDPGSTDSFVAAIRTFYNRRPEFAAMGENGRAYLQKHLNKDKCVREYVDILRGVATRA